MSNVLTPPFIPFTTELKEAMYSLPTGLYKVYDFIASEIFRWKDSRVTLEKELACSFISARINLSVSSVSRAIKKLKALGYIEIVKEGVKGVGSIIKLLPCKSAQMTCKNAKNTPAKMQGNKETINIKKTNKQQSVDVVSQNSLSEDPCSGEKNIIPENNNENFSQSPSINCEKNNILITPQNSTNTVNNSIALTPEKYKVFGREVNNTGIKGAEKVDTLYNTETVKGFNSTDTLKADTVNVSSRVVSNETHPLPREEYKKLSTAASGLGIKSSLLSFGIKELQKRQCRDIKPILQDILSQIKSRVSIIKQVPAYFFSLCQNVDFEEAVPTALNNGSNTKEFSEDGTTSTTNSNSGGFRPVPENFLSDCSSPLPMELSPVDLLKQKRKEFSQQIYDGFLIGRIKYVLSSQGERQKIITCSSTGFSYLKNGHLKNAYWNELPEKLLNPLFFVEETYETEIA